MVSSARGMEMHFDLGLVSFVRSVVTLMESEVEERRHCFFAAALATQEVAIFGDGVDRSRTGRSTVLMISNGVGAVAAVVRRRREKKTPFFSFFDFRWLGSGT